MLAKRLRSVKLPQECNANTGLHRLNGFPAHVLCELFDTKSNACIELKYQQCSILFFSVLLSLKISTKLKEIPTPSPRSPHFHILAHRPCKLAYPSDNMLHSSVFTHSQGEEEFSHVRIESHPIDPCKCFHLGVTSNKM